MRTKTKLSVLIRTFIVAVIAILPTLGSDCNTDNTIGTPGGDIAGTWQLDFVQGYLQDICSNEQVIFPSNTSGDASLTCPGGTTLSRAYTYNNDVLNYTSTGLQYKVSTSGTTLLILTGVNVARTLTYKHPAATDAPVTTGNTPGMNSSELNLSK
jgi:hypothetical protein